MKTSICSSRGEAFLPGYSVPCSASYRSHGTCIRSASSSALGSTPPRKLVCSACRLRKSRMACRFWTVLIFSCPFHRGNVADGYHRQRVDDRRLWLGLCQTGSKALVQSHDHRRIGGRGPLHRKCRGVGADRKKKLGLEGWFWDVVSSLNGNLTNFGLVIVGIFIASWMLSAAVYRAKGFDDLHAAQGC